MNVAVRKGWIVSAFHPQTLGVVKHGRVVSVGSKYARIDYGELNGGVVRTRLADVVEVVEAH